MQQDTVCATPGHLQPRCLRCRALEAAHAFLEVCHAHLQVHRGNWEQSRLVGRLRSPDVASTNASCLQDTADHDSLQVSQVWCMSGMVSWQVHPPHKQEQTLPGLMLTALHARTHLEMPILVQSCHKLAIGGHSQPHDRRAHGGNLLSSICIHGHHMAVGSQQHLQAGTGCDASTPNVVLSK